MKSSHALLGLTVLGFIAPAIACDRSRERLSCAGDEVITPSAHSGRILRQGPSGAVVRVGERDQVYDARVLYVRMGCLADLCVGDRAAAASGHMGLIEGLNAQRNRVAIRLEEDGRTYLYDLETVAPTRGCAAGLCVGDEVQTAERFTGKVVGANPYTGNLIVKLDANGANYPHGASTLQMKRETNAPEREASRRLRQLASGFQFQLERGQAPLAEIAAAPRALTLPVLPGMAPKALPVADEPAPLRAIAVPEEDIAPAAAPAAPMRLETQPVRRVEAPGEPIHSTVPQAGRYESKARTDVPVWR